MITIEFDYDVTWNILGQSDTLPHRESS